MTQNTAPAPNQIPSDDNTPNIDPDRIDSILARAQHVFGIVLLALMAYFIIPEYSKKKYRDAEQELDARKTELISELNRADSVYRIRYNEMSNTYRVAQTAVRDALFATKRERDIALDALQFAYNAHHAVIRDAYRQQKDSLDVLYNKNREKLDSVRALIRGKSKVK